MTVATAMQLGYPSNHTQAYIRRPALRSCLGIWEQGHGLRAARATHVRGRSTYEGCDSAPAWRVAGLNLHGGRSSFELAAAMPCTDPADICSRDGSATLR